MRPSSQTVILCGNLVAAQGDVPAAELRERDVCLLPAVEPVQTKGLTASMPSMSRKSARFSV